jgi:hypothetical protein
MFRYNSQRVLITRFMFGPLIKTAAKVIEDLEGKEMTVFMLTLEFFYGRNAIVVDVIEWKESQP